MTKRFIDLRPIQDIIEAIRKEHEDAAARAIRRVENNRRALADLDAAGVELQLGRWDRGEYVDVDLGEMPKSKAGRREFALKLNAIRRALGCALKVTGKSVA